MWSLPDIRRLNEDAEKFASTLEKIVSTGQGKNGEPVPCGIDYDGEHHGEVVLEKYFDIFSDKPKGIVAMCERHRDRIGTPEGYFYCDGCERLMIENYTWEKYSHTDEGGDVCLNCYAESVVKDDSRWIKLTKAAIDALTVRDLHRAPHIIAVNGPIPEGLEFWRNTEVDSTSGGRLTGFSSAELGPEGALAEIKANLHELRRRGRKRAILILDGAYQFAVSIGIYTDKSRRKNHGE